MKSQQCQVDLREAMRKKKIILKNYHQQAYLVKETTEDGAADDLLALEKQRKEAIPKKLKEDPPEMQREKKLNGASIMLKLYEKEREEVCRNNYNMMETFFLQQKQEQMFKSFILPGQKVEEGETLEQSKVDSKNSRRDFGNFIKTYSITFLNYLK